MPDKNFSHHRISGEWLVYPYSLDADFSPDIASTAQSHVVPECAHLQPVLHPERHYWGEHLRFLNETAWVYRKTFTAPDTAHTRARIRFEGVDYFASVWLNGKFVGEHEGHFAPFTFDVTEALNPGGENLLIVCVNSPWDEPTRHGTYPTDHVLRGLVKGLYEHGEGVIPPNVNPLGIWRPVRLILDNGVSINHIRIRTKIDGTVNLRITVSNTTNQDWEGALALDVAADNHDGPGMDESVTVKLSPGTNYIDHTLQIPEPRLWWTWDHGKPNLYRLNASLQTDNILSEKTEIFGLREVELDRAPEKFTYRINGRPVSIRGTSYMPGLYMSLCDREHLSRDVDFALKANLNLLRVHVHVSPPELYDLCNRAGMLILQDFELNWMHDPSPKFEKRAIAVQREMFALLGNHPAVITWVCHNEPTMVFTRRQNLEKHPDPALYADALELDTTRPIFLCSGQMESDWQRAGDVHTYYGALWTANYTDVYQHHFTFNTEFGFESPAARETLQQYPDVWERLQHLDGQIEDLWGYQAELVQFHVEHLRRIRANGCAGYIHFWLADLVPQVGCGVLDANRQPKGGYEALRRASQPLLVALEHDGSRPIALWIFNDTPQTYPGVTVKWEVYDAENQLLLNEQIVFDVAANASQLVARADWDVNPADCARVEMSLRDADGEILSRNSYRHPFQPTPRPRGYPWKFDPYLGTKVFDRPGAHSLADQSGNPLMKFIPLTVREKTAEWALRQQLPVRAQSIIAKFIDRLNR